MCVCVQTNFSERGTSLQKRMLQTAPKLSKGVMLFSIRKPQHVFAAKPRFPSGSMLSYASWVQNSSYCEMAVRSSPARPLLGCVCLDYLDLSRNRGAADTKISILMKEFTYSLDTPNGSQLLFNRDRWWWWWRWRWWWWWWWTSLDLGCHVFRQTHWVGWTFEAPGGLLWNAPDPEAILCPRKFNTTDHVQGLGFSVTISRLTLSIQGMKKTESVTWNGLETHVLTVVTTDRPCNALQTQDRPWRVITAISGKKYPEIPRPIWDGSPRNFWPKV